MAYKWEFIDPETCKADVFGFDKLWAVKVRRHNGEKDVRSVYIEGWSVVADFLEYNPITGYKLRNNGDWFIFAAKGE